MGNCLITRRGGSADFKEMCTISLMGNSYCGIYGETAQVGVGQADLTGNYMKVSKGATCVILKAGKYRLSYFNATKMTGASVTNEYAVGDEIAGSIGGGSPRIVIIEAL